MRLFRRHKRVAQPVGDKEIEVDKRLVSSIKEAMASPAPKPRRRRWICDAREELRKVNEEEDKRMGRRKR